MLSEICSNEDYEKALDEAYDLMDSEKGTKNGERLDKLVDLIVEYEEKYIPL